MDIHDLILKYLSIVLSWPVIIFIIFIIIIRTFKTQLSNFFDKMKSMKGEGQGFKIELSAEELAQSQTRIAKEEAEVEIEVEVKPKHKYLEHVEVDPNKAYTEYIQQGKELKFERGYTVIYGSQIKLLEYLATYPGTGVALSAAKYYYDIYWGKTFSSSYTLENYLSFLYAYEFIENIPNEYIKITPLGLEFLSYIKQRYNLIIENKKF